MTELIRLRFLAEVNPPTPGFDRLGDTDEVSFLPLEAVWSDWRLDVSRSRPKAEVATGYVRFVRGDVLCPKVTPTFQAGRAALLENLPTDFGAASTEVHVLRAKPERADPGFIRFGLLTKRFLEEGASRFQGVAGLQRVPDSFVRDFEVVDHPLDEQRRIAAFLDDQVARIDRAIALRERQLNTATSLTSSAMDSLFDGEALPVKQLLKQSPCYGVLVPRFVDSGIPFIRIGDLSGRTIASDLIHIDKVQSVEYRRTVVKSGDVLVGVVGSIDKSAIVDADSAGSNVARAVARLVPRSDVPSEVIWGWTKTAKYRDQARLATQSDTAQPTLNMGDLKNFPIHISGRVPLSVMADRIVAVSDRTKSFQAVLISSAQLLRERKRSLITAAVTGEFDISSASTRALDGVAS